MPKTLVIGGGGYVGSVLCPELVAHGHTVVAYDTFWYGKHVLPHSVNIVVGDMRDIPLLKESLAGCDNVIHLACISNDPSFDLNPELGKAINLDCFPSVCQAVREAGVKHFIYASSSSVYGIHDGDVTEQTECNPLTDYSRFKLECERYLRTKDMGNTMWTIVRPATVCGAAPRLRLDLIVNALTVSALANRKITVHGGAQLRPNVVIKDMVRAYVAILGADSRRVYRETFNVGGTNLSVEKLAHKVASTIKDPELIIETTPTDDLRSYHINSERIYSKLSFEPLYSIENAVYSLMAVFPHLTYPMLNSDYYNIKKMQEINPI